MPGLRRGDGGRQRALSDRVATVGPDGSRAFRCAECEARARGVTDDLPPDADVGTIADNGAMVGVNLLGGGGF